MSDDDSPDNVLQMPRIGSPPPPPAPPPPTLDEESQAPDEAPGGVRISAFDAPAVPHAPSTAGSVPAALRSDGVTPAAPDPHGLPPRTGALSLAAVLAIALAAFEGLQTWLQEAGPRRAEAAKHEREMDLLAAKARADAARLGAEADKEHARARVPSSHAYGRSALGRGAGGPGRAGGGVGPGRSGSGRTAPSGASTQGRSTGAGGRAPGGRAGLGSSGSPAGAGRNGGSSGRNGAGGTRNGPSQDRNGGLRGRNGGTGGGRAGGSGNTAGSGTRGAGAAGGARGPAPGTDEKGRRSPRQAVAEWWRKGKKSAGGSGGSGSSGGSGATTGPKPSRGGSGTAASGGRGPVKGGSTFWDDLKNRVGAGGRSKPSRSTDGTPPNHGTGKPPTVGGATGSSSQDRVHLKDAAWEAVNDRWKERRDAWTADASERRRGKNDARDGGKSGSGWRRKADSGGRRKQDHAPRGGEPGPHGYDQPRSSPFDQGPEGPVTITVEQVDPPGTHAKRWEPTAIAPSRQALPKQAAPVLPRAPQRPAGPRPGTTRRKEPLPMPPARTKPAGSAAPVSASVPATGRMSLQHATDISLDSALQALMKLTTAGMDTHDDCAALERQARHLLSQLEQMALDLAATHNVNGPRTMKAVSALMEAVAQLIVQAHRMAKAALDAAELSEAEENAMARDYRPTQIAAIDAGLATPSARIHNEN